MLRPNQRSCISASTRRYAREVPGLMCRVSDTQSPWQSPYTPLVEPYTNARGMLRSRKVRSSARVRGSVLPCGSSLGGGARCTTWVPRPASRRNVAGSSRLPCSGVMFFPRISATRELDEVNARTLMRLGSKRAARRPTSPHPMIKIRWRRKRAGNAPKGFRFEGKIGAPRK